MFEMSSSIEKKLASAPHGLEILTRGEQICGMNVLHGFAVTKIKTIPSMTAAQHFASGPAEWLWSSLTYWKKGPARAQTEVMIDTEAILASWKRSRLLR